MKVELMAIKQSNKKSQINLLQEEQGSHLTWPEMTGLRKFLPRLCICPVNMYTMLVFATSHPSEYRYLSIWFQQEKQARKEQQRMVA